MELDPTQIKAVEHAISKPFSVITGGAGTGKTTIVKEIIRRLKNKESEKHHVTSYKKSEVKINLCAPSGKAAARMKEATGRAASTIHRMLGSNGIEFTVEDLTGYTVIVDESSMVDSSMMAEIVKRTPDRLIFVGDQAQLSPVGVGQPFHDIAACRPEAVAKLTKCYRNSEAVFKAATAIRNGENPLDSDESESEKWDFIKVGNPELAQKTIMDWIKLDNFIDFEQDIILCPRNGTTVDDACTVKGLNEAIVNFVNPREYGEKWKIGDRVINTKNCAEKNVWNGTTGTIHSIDSDYKIWVQLDDPITQGRRQIDKVLFDKEMMKNLQLAYALTVHKSQGSQYRKVIFCCLNRDKFQLDRSLIYTAVTRTKQQCIAIGNIGALHSGIQTVKQKNTVLQELARGENGSNNKSTH